MSSSRDTRPFGFLLRVAVFALVFAGSAEVWFRVAMPADQMPVNYQEHPSTISRYDPNGPTSGLCTYGRLCLRMGRWRVNDAGWISGVDYVPAADRSRPLVALIGDSYIAGTQTDVGQQVDAYVREMLHTDCYSFGVAGWYLEQYVAVSRYVGRRFEPDVVVVFLDSGSVVSSLRENGVVSPFLWQIRARGDSFEEVAPTAAYVAGYKKRLAIKSALVRYLRYNAQLTLPGMETANIPQPGSDGSGVEQDLLPAAEFMVDRLCGQSPGTPIVFVARGDSARYLPVGDVPHVPLPPDAAAVEVACKGRPQCSFIDLRYAFTRDWAAHHVRFEAADRAHWNAYANRLVARTLVDFLVENRLLERP